MEKRIVEIISCASCPKRYNNYLPDGKTPKLWCAEFNKEIKPFEGQFPGFCDLPTFSDLEPDEPDYTGSTNDIYDLPGGLGN